MPGESGLPSPPSEDTGALRVPGIERGPRVEFTFNGRTIPADEGMTVAAALMCAGIRASRSSRTGMGRGYYCGMGICWECLVVVAGRGQIRSCLEPVTPGLEVSSVSLEAAGE